MWCIHQVILFTNPSYSEPKCNGFSGWIVSYYRVTIPSQFKVKMAIKVSLRSLAPRFGSPRCWAAVLCQCLRSRVFVVSVVSHLSPRPSKDPHHGSASPRHAALKTTKPEVAHLSSSDGAPGARNLCSWTRGRPGIPLWICSAPCLSVRLGVVLGRP